MYMYIHIYNCTCTDVRTCIKYIFVHHMIFLCTVYSSAPQEVVDPLIYEGFVEELVEVLEIRDSSDELVVRYILHVHATKLNQYIHTLSLSFTHAHTHDQYVYMYINMRSTIGPL